MNNIKIMESIENLDVLIDGVTKRVKNERKKKNEGWFVGDLWATYDNMNMIIWIIWVNFFSFTLSFKQYRD